MRLSIPIRFGLVILALAACGEKEKPGPPQPVKPVTARPEAPPEASGFVDRSAFAGFTFKNHTGKESQKDFIVEAKGGGALVLDYDGDGDMDIYVVDGNTYSVDQEGNVTSKTTHPDAWNRLMRNDGNWHFTDVTEQAGVGDRSYGFGGGVGDYDNDGRPDIYVCNWGANKLYRNRGDGTFEDVTEKAGVAGHESYYSTCASFFDADGDGDLDLYVSNYNDIGAYIKDRKGVGRGARWREMNVYAGPKGIPGVLDRFYRNNGDGTFTDETKEALKNQVARYAFTSVAGDYDSDGDLDLYVVNDVRRNTMWENDGTGHFLDIGDESGTSMNNAMGKQAGMGNDSVDYDQDGRPDIFTTNFEQDTNTLFHNITRPGHHMLFEDVTERVGLAKGDFLKVCWGTKFQDFNLDGWMDIFIAAGHVYMEIDKFYATAGVTYKQVPSLWYNQGPPDWHFRNVSDEVGGPGLHIPKTGRAVCCADFDDDGDIDVYIAGLNDTPLLLENRLPREGNWFQLDLVRKHPRPDGSVRYLSPIGTRATVIAGGGKIRQMIEYHRSAGFISTHDRRLHWGVGENDVIDRLEVKWFGGKTQVFTNLPANHLYRLEEGGKPEVVR